MKNQPDKKLSLKTIILSFAAHVKDDNRNDTGKLKSFYSDFEMARIATARLGREYTEDAVRKARKRQGIERCTEWGGARKGAGRPQSGGQGGNTKVFKRHSQSVSNSNLILWCPNVYESKRDANGNIVCSEFDYFNNKYTRQQAYVLRDEFHDCRSANLPARITPAPIGMQACSGSPDDYKDPNTDYGNNKTRNRQKFNGINGQ